MDSGFQSQLDEMMGKLQEHRDSLVAAQRELAKYTVTVQSKDRMVTVVAGAQGDVREIKFHTDGYRDMAPAELGAALVEVIGQAREQAGQKVRETASPFQGAGAALRRSMTGGSELDDLMGPLRDMWAGPAGAGGSAPGGSGSTGRGAGGNGTGTGKGAGQNPAAKGKGGTADG
ncbi:YbaB/EbfC family nucleoid-associated protein [Streptomyces sp. NBC_01089]|uniref:YbaB/EbfC family nucleoid-associated protein n=1 Tax=Streptomyces sp. NBC_01089 TaxID=2903747 RepID=UPI00386C3F59|nr:YbaB/EbfC family nucleoid-associated protein [Streptomyces sp. NBC_01089]